MIEHHVDIFPWNESFNTGIHEIDQQHEMLVHLLNKVASFITLQSKNVNLDALLQELVDYAAYHFDTEDRYWTEVLYDSPYTKQHNDIHTSFVQRVSEMKANLDSLSEEKWLEELLSFLAGWLASHILESDKYMALLTQAVKSGMSQEEASVWADEQMRGSAKEAINVILAAYKSLSANTIRLMREIKAGNKTLNKLTESDLHLQAAMDYAQIGRWSRVYGESIADWSPQMYSLFGLTTEATSCPDTLRSIMKDEFHQRYFNSLNRCFETGKEHHVEFQITRPNDGELRWIECRGKRLNKEDGTKKQISGFIQDITERKENEEQVRQLAYYDSLTSLPNRRLLLDRLEQAIAVSERSKVYNALLFLDIDDFKTVNDSHGHEFGDVLLQQAASRIRQCIRKGDTLARIGGDEFVIILSGLDQAEMEAATKTELVAEKVLNALSLSYWLDNQEINSGASIGITLFNDSLISSSELMKQADIAMYQAKQQGKNALSFYDPQMQKDITARMELERELRHAVEAQQFELYYQPQVDHCNHVTGAEVLIRWLHPEKGLISPDNFIPIAEETGLIVPMGEWVLKTACKQLRQWQEIEETRHLSLSVNVSYKQFSQPGFVSMVRKLAGDYGIGHGKLKLELTETQLADDIEQTIAYMETLKKQGIQFSLDDFGTGYSSLQYLKRLPLSQLKIDRSFVDELESDINDQSIVKTIILMANALAIDVIAEGVETIEQRNYLYKHSCLSYQGYFFSKPVSIHEFEVCLKMLNATRQTV